MDWTSSNLRQGSEHQDISELQDEYRQSSISMDDDIDESFPAPFEFIDIETSLSLSDVMNYPGPRIRPSKSSDPLRAFRVQTSDFSNTLHFETKNETKESLPEISLQEAEEVVHECESQLSLQHLPFPSQSLQTSQTLETEFGCLAVGPSVEAFVELERPLATQQLELLAEPFTDVKDLVRDMHTQNDKIILDDPSIVSHVSPPHLQHEYFFSGCSDSKSKAQKLASYFYDKPNPKCVARFQSWIEREVPSEAVLAFISTKLRTYLTAKTDDYIFFELSILIREIDPRRDGNFLKTEAEKAHKQRCNTQRTQQRRRQASQMSSLMSSSPESSSISLSTVSSSQHFNQDQSLISMSPRKRKAESCLVLQDDNILDGIVSGPTLTPMNYNLNTSTPASGNLVEWLALQPQRLIHSRAPSSTSSLPPTATTMKLDEEHRAVLAKKLAFKVSKKFANRMKFYYQFLAEFSHDGHHPTMFDLTFVELDMENYLEGTDSVPEFNTKLSMLTDFVRAQVKDARKRLLGSKSRQKRRKTLQDS